MAGRIGARIIPLDRVEDVLHKERRDGKDSYLPLRPPAVKVEIRDPLAPGAGRFKLVAKVEGSSVPLRFTETSFRQLCGLANVPSPLLTKAPAALGLNLLRCMLEASEAGEGRPYLLRMRAARRPTLRAILPQSFVRLDDLSVFATLRKAVEKRDVQVASLKVDEDTWHTRLLVGEPINLGSVAAPDIVSPGFDLITSETGSHPLEMRHLLLRQVCLNGMTEAAEQKSAFRNRCTAVERHVLEDRLARALGQAAEKGRDMAAQLSGSRSDYVPDPRGEIDRIFRHFRLGNPSGRIGEWVAAEIMQSDTLFGVSRWSICQSFSAVARGLDHARRMLIEDAMGSYLMRGIDGGKGKVSDQ